MLYSANEPDNIMQDGVMVISSAHFNMFYYNSDFSIHSFSHK